MSDRRVFVFDMDGVLVDSEKEWGKSEPRILEGMFGENIARGIGDTVGISVGQIYEKAVELGTRMDKGKFNRLYDEVAMRVYRRCTISKNTDTLVAYLRTRGCRVALLSSSPMSWIDQVIVRLPWRNKLSAVLSLNEHHELRAKPAPDGYRFILKELGVFVRNSVALEDSNPGIKSAKGAGLFTVGYREHLPDGYVQQGADITAENMDDVFSIVSRDTIAKRKRA